MSRRGTGPAPRTWLAEADLRDNTPNGWRSSPFGSQDLKPQDWKEPEKDGDKANIAAAQFHHSIAQHLTWAIERSGKPVSAIATEVGMSTDGLYRVLNGSQHLYVTDLARIVTACGRVPTFGLRLPEAESPDKDNATKTKPAN